MRSALLCAAGVVLLLIAGPGKAQTVKPATVEALRQQAKAVLAQTEGDITIPGLKQRVEVLRDRWGIPHIYAENGHDLFLAQGFVAAQDRLFQMDLWRRMALGETAELVGKAGLEGDRFARLIRYRGDLDAEWQSYSPDAREIATAFTQGINACIDHIGAKLPIEFQILKYRPKRWRPEDVLGRMSGIIMTGNFETEIFRAVLLAKLGAEKAHRLAPTDPRLPWTAVPGLDVKAIPVNVVDGYYAATAKLSFAATKQESNNWVVDGKHSVSGQPLLASDPHRAIALPSLRYLVHLHAPGWNVIGSGEPGLPGVAIGHNERIAWGFTIVGTDQADIFVEQLNPDNASEYKVGDHWEKITTVRETVAVKGEKEPVALELRFSRHGPILYEDVKAHQAFALKWVGSEPGAAAYLGALALDRASNRKELLAALKSWKLPCENMIYADVDGNIGWVATALTPVRKNYNGLLPVPGNGPYGWQRFLNVAELPQEFNPSRGYLATANHNILPKDYPHPIAFDWAPNYRINRVRQRLESKQKFTLADFESIQHDVISQPGQVLARLVRTLKLQDNKLEKYLALLRSWDGELSRESPAGPLYAAWLAALTKEFFLSRLPKELHAHRREMSSIPVLLNALEHPEAMWFGPNPQVGRDQLLRTTFARAVATVQKRLGDDPATWSWGKLHPVHFRHPLAALGPAYAAVLDLAPVGRPGDVSTPNNTRYNDKFEQVHGATYRQVLDLADWDKGRATSAPGQSGQPGSPHYGDLLPLWAEGRYFPLAFSRRQVEQLTEQRLRLLPAQN